MTGVASNEILSNSVEERAALSAVLEVRLRQLSGGQFHGHIKAAQVGHAGLYSDRWSQSVFCSGAIPGDHVLIAATTGTRGTVDWCGAGVRDHCLAVAIPGNQVDFIIPADTDYVALVLPTSCLEATFGDIAVEKFIKSGMQYARTEPIKGRRFLDRIQRVIHAGLNDPESLAPAGNCKAIEADLLDDLAELGIFSIDDLTTLSLPAQRDIIRKAVSAAQTLEEQITVPQFAAKIEVGQRNLELAFKRYLGTTPKRFLISCRMHHVHRELRSRSPESHCVTAVASSLGFTELGRFSGDYFQLFGETPSATLRAPPLPRGRLVLDMIDN